jgi:hypothetical protein
MQNTDLDGVFGFCDPGTEREGDKDGGRGTKPAMSSDSHKISCW